MSRIEVRRARAEDVPRIIELWDELLSLHERLDPRFARRESAAITFEAFVRHNAEHEASVVLVAEADAGIVGFCMAAATELPPVYDTGPNAEIFDLAVTERYRRQGIGRRLVGELREWARNRGLGRIELRAAVANPVARAFWHAVGAVPLLEMLTLDPGREAPEHAARS